MAPSPLPTPDPTPHLCLWVCPTPCLAQPATPSHTAQPPGIGRRSQTPLCERNETHILYMHIHAFDMALHVVALGRQASQISSLMTPLCLADTHLYTHTRWPWPILPTHVYRRLRIRRGRARVHTERGGDGAPCCPVLHGTVTSTHRRCASAT